MTLTVPDNASGKPAAQADLAPELAAGFMGVVMLETRFPRLPGDIGHPAAFGVPVNFRIIKGIWPEKVVQSAAGLRGGRVLPGLIMVMRQLEREGAKAITTSCGFLVLLQKELQAAVKVPLISSSLMQLPRLLASQAQVGVLTMNAHKLGAEHLRAAGVPRERLKDVLVQGMATQGEFVTAILHNRLEMDVSQAGAEVVAAALALKQREPSLAHLVLECPSMPPYREAIEVATGLKTWALTDDDRLLRPFRHFA